MVPGLHVSQIDANKWAITARGFNGQFANKLLVMIDGRSVYTPLFSGVFWDVQDVMLEDVDRIEVIRGPGGTMWGANAVNGVVNIITKSAHDTEGISVSGGAGTLERRFTEARVGGSFGGAAARGYIKYFDRADMKTNTGAQANDAWSMTRGGFRMDWDLGEHDEVTLQGDYYDGKVDDTLALGIPSRQLVNGGNLLSRWNHVTDSGAATQLQFYYDRTERTVGFLLTEERNAVDLELNHHFAPSKRHSLVIGGGYRMVADEISPMAISFTPTNTTDHLAQLFLQDEISVVDGLLSFTLGSKFEYNNYTGFEFQPSARVLLTPDPRHSLWGAISRAVRTPSRADLHLATTAPSTDLPDTIDTFTGNPGFLSEVLWAYELGYRGQVLDDVSLDLAAYYHDYEDLRSTEVLASAVGPAPAAGASAPSARSPSATSSTPRPGASRPAPPGSQPRDGSCRPATPTWNST
jgi:iron complex outermembrane receptor protein